jgi:NAD(P) transhydrogenase subunit alpha
MWIGIPKEILHQERRVAATPETVAEYVKAGWQVLVEHDAGAGIFCSDPLYQQAGAEIASDVRELYRRADVVLKVKQPTRHEGLGVSEEELLREGGTLVTFLHPANPGHHGMVRTLARRQITSFTMDGIPRTSRAQRMDALTSMSTVTGYKSVLLAANDLPRFVPLMGTAVGTVKPARFLIVGAGVVGLQALATVKRLGGISHCVDIRAAAREEARSLGAKIAGFEVPEDLAMGTGGYARALPTEWVEQERLALMPIVEDVDVVILSALVPGEVAPVLVTDEMIGRMRPGSVVVDVAIDQGGNCAATRPGEVVQVHGVTVSGVQNIPGRMPVHATWMYAKNLLAYVENLFKRGPGQVDWDDDIVQSSVVTRDGRIVHAGALKAMGQGQPGL